MASEVDGSSSSFLDLRLPDFNEGLQDEFGTIEENNSKISSDQFIEDGAPFDVDEDTFDVDKDDMDLAHLNKQFMMLFQQGLSLQHQRDAVCINEQPRKRYPLHRNPTAVELEDPIYGQYNYRQAGVYRAGLYETVWAFDTLQHAWREGVILDFGKDGAFRYLVRFRLDFYRSLVLPINIRPLGPIRPQPNDVFPDAFHPDRAHSESATKRHVLSNPIETQYSRYDPADLSSAQYTQLTRWSSDCTGGMGDLYSDGDPDLDDNASVPRYLPRRRSAGSTSSVGSLPRRRSAGSTSSVGSLKRNDIPTRSVL